MLYLVTHSLTTNFCREEYELLEAVQAKLVVHPLTAPVLGNDHKEFRGRENPVSEPQSSSNFLRCDMKYHFTACIGLVIKFACDVDIYK